MERDRDTERIIIYVHKLGRLCVSLLTKFKFCVRHNLTGMCYMIRFHSPSDVVVGFGVVVVVVVVHSMKHCLNFVCVTVSVV